MVKDEKCTYKNTFTLGAAFKILGIALEEGAAFLTSKLQEKDFSTEVLDQNFLDLEAGYQYIIDQCKEACDIVDCSKKI